MDKLFKTCPNCGESYMFTEVVIVHPYKRARMWWCHAAEDICKGIPREKVMATKEMFEDFPIGKNARKKLLEILEVKIKKCKGCKGVSPKICLTNFPFRCAELWDAHEEGCKYNSGNHETLVITDQNGKLIMSGFLGKT